MKGRRSSQSGLRRADEWLNITVATLQGPNVSPLQPSLQSLDFVTLIVHLSLQLSSLAFVAVSPSHAL